MRGRKLSGHISDNLRVAITYRGHRSTGRKRVCTWKTLKAGASPQQSTAVLQGQTEVFSETAMFLPPSPGMLMLKAMTEALEGKSETM